MSRWGLDRGALLQLLRRPRVAIPDLIENDRGWFVPLIGFSLFSFVEGLDGTATRLPDLSAGAVILISLAAASIFGGWSWAGMFGGALHVSSRLFGGKKGVADTIKAIGYGVLWPSLIAAPAAAAALLAGYRDERFPLAALVPVLVWLAAALWANYAVVAALRVHHGFGWLRAAAAYVLPFVTVFLLAAGYFIL